MKKKGLRRILVLTLVTVLAIGWFVAYRAVNKWYEPLRDPTTTVTYEMGQRHLIYRRGIHIGNYLHLIGLIVGELAGDIETADRVYLIAKEVNTEGPTLRI